MTAAALCSAGINIPCPKCASPAGDRCVSSSGRVLDKTHDARWRAERDQKPTYQWFLDRTQWRRSA